MTFISLEFVIFLIIVFTIYWKIKASYRWMLLFISSYYFYMCWNVEYVGLIFITTYISYICAIKVEKSQSVKEKKRWLFLCLVICLGILFLFKYFNFCFLSISKILGAMSITLHPMTLNLLLPVGISFYTFQTVGYVLDVYRGTIPAERHFGIYATFISFFPQLVAGPIERTVNLLPQIKEDRVFDYSLAVVGLRQMLLGCFKKVVIADNLAIYVDMVYNNLPVYDGGALLFAAVFFSFQIYCDFSGYSDIAIGCAKLFGIKLMTNFDRPYLAMSVKEFWSRWHISLSTWFRDYLYIPLGGNRCGKLCHKINILITFLASGLWHGADWTFVFWGGDSWRSTSC